MIDVDAAIAEIANPERAIHNFKSPRCIVSMPWVGSCA
jgi:hypothetical protein